jgi:hypothetical protein
MNNISEMTFDEFISWATGVIIIRLGTGEKLKSTMWEIMIVFVNQWLPENGWEKK